MCQIQQLNQQINNMEHVLSWIEWSLTCTPDQFRTADIDMFRIAMRDSVTHELKQAKRRLAALQCDDVNTIFTYQLLQAAGIQCTLSESLICLPIPEKK